MKTSTTIKVLGSATLFAFSALAVGCADQTPAHQTSSGGSAAVSGNVALEEALADAESGKNPDRARASLEAFLANGTLSNEDRVRVDLALARLVETTDRERAAKLLEDAVVLGDHAAETRLFELLTGKAPPAMRRSEATVAPIASVLANAFPAATPERKVDVDVVRIGAPHAERGMDDLGTFEIAGALRQKALDACGGCADPRTNISATRSSEPLWTAFPRYASKLDHALVVVYVDEQTVVPERYAQWLAAPTADIKAALDRNEGFVAVKERPNAPPLVTIAAPRASLFHTVESSFASLSELPKQPHVVSLPKGLSPDEMHDVLGPRLKEMRRCAAARVGGTDALDPLRHELSVTYQIKGNGAVTDVHVDGKGDDPAMRACLEKAVSGAQFPAWSKDPEATSTEHIKLGLSIATSGSPGGHEVRDVHRVIRTFKKMKETHETRVTP